MVWQGLTMALRPPYRQKFQALLSTDNDSGRKTAFVNLGEQKEDLRDWLKEGSRARNASC